MYQSELNQILQSSYQEQDETMSQFVRRTNRLYSRLDMQVHEKVKLNFILQSVHPEYRTFLFEKEFNLLEESKIKFLEIHKVLENVLFASNFNERNKRPNKLAALQISSNLEPVTAPLSFSYDPAFYKRTKYSKLASERPTEEQKSVFLLPLWPSRTYFLYMHR